MIKTLGTIALLAAAAFTGDDCIPHCRNGQDPELAAAEFAKKIGGQVRGVACTGSDTDGDGYVTCEVALSEPDQEGHYGIKLQCAGLGDDALVSGTNRCASGCKRSPWTKQ